MRRRLLLAAALVTVTGLSAAAMYLRRGADGPSLGTDVASRGSIVSVVSATGSIEAVETVQVGSQASGVVSALYADFNSIVKKGQVLARLDPAVIQAEITRGEANLAGAEADRDRLQVMLGDADAKLARAKSLAERQLIAQTDFDAAVTARQSAEAQLRASEAQVTQARAALSQSRVTLQKTVITSPIDGIVISRSVDLGQTVAASLQAPTLFTLAADLSRMQLKASIDESDLGSIRQRQAVTFRVDAFPNKTFNGVVEQVRLNPVIEQNVVTYAAIISAANPELELKPGMTATLTVEVARRDDVLRVPSAALRFKPNSTVLAAFGAAPLPAVARTTGTGATAAAPTGTAGTKVTASSNQGTVWIYESDTLRAAAVTTGITDGVFTEIVDGPIEPGTTLATRVSVPSATSTAAPSSVTNPLMGPQPPRR